VKYIRDWNSEIDIAIEKPVGYRFINNPRVIDILLHFRKDRSGKKEKLLG